MLTRWRPAISALFAASLAGVACDDETATDDHQTVRSSLARDLAPEVPGAEARARAEGNHALTWDLFSRTAGADGNFAISPHSVRIAFAMLHAGARGATADEMAAALHFGTDAEALHRAMNDLDLQLMDRRRAADPEQELDPIELRSANAFWGQAGLAWQNDYLDVLAVNYGAGIETVDFATTPERAREVINGWVEDRTEDLIVDLLPEGSIDSNTLMVLTNALYFAAPWEVPFEADRTIESEFTRLDGSTTTVDMMRQMVTHRYAEGDDFAVVELAYRDAELSMVLFVPDAGAFEAFTATASAAMLERAVAELTPARVNLSLPRFEVETELRLRSALTSMGMVAAFGPGADFGGIVETEPLQVDDAYHQVFVSVNERGTVAAAATAIVGNGANGSTPDYTLRIDRPFYFAIRDRPTDVWLFFGRVTDP